MQDLPKTGLLRLSQIIGQPEVTQEQAAANRVANRYALEKAKAVAEANGTEKIGHFRRLPTTPQPAITPVIPIQKTMWWDGVKSGRFPKPVKLGPRATAWRAEDIRRLIEQGVSK